MVEKMSGPTTTDALLAKLSGSAKKTHRKSISLLFLGLRKESSAFILSLLREAGLAPLGRVIHDEESLLATLSQRSWDLLLHSTDVPTPLKLHTAQSSILGLAKDLPVIHIDEGLTEDQQSELLSENIHLVCSPEKHHLFLLQIEQELKQLETRRMLRQSQSLLEKAEVRMQSFIDEVKTAICFCKEGRIIYANESFSRLFGYDHSSCSGLQLDKLISPLQREQFWHSLHEYMHDIDSPDTLELNAVRFDNTSFKAVISMEPGIFHDRECFLLSFRQDTKHTQSHAFGDQDPISGLKNQAAFMTQLEHTVKKALHGGHDCNLLYLSLDQHKVIAEEAGPAGADQLIRDVADVLREHINIAHTVARLDSSSFGIIFFDPDVKKSSLLANTLCRAIAHIDRKIENYTLHTTCSIGIAPINDSVPRGSDLIARARLAAESLHYGNRTGNGFSVYQPEKQTTITTADSKAVIRVLDSIQNNRFRLLFQPIVPLHIEEKAANYEILLRLLSDAGDEISPNIFMSDLGDDEVMAKMDFWVLEECLKLLRLEFNAGRRNRLFINLTGRTLRNKEVLPWLSEKIRELRLPADHLVFQISESDAIASPDYARAFCKGLKQLHCKTCLKHFGCTSESDNLLRELGSQYIKLDGSYINDLNSQLISIDQLEWMLKPLLQQDKLIIVPMVESTRLMSKLFRLGVHLVQGYYLQPPRAQMDYPFFDE